jgi:hypothetical protein
MMREDAVAESALITQAIRDTQEQFPDEHRAYQNWAKWCRDRRGIYPAGTTAPSIWQEAATSKWEFDEPEAYEPHIPMVAAPKGDKPQAEDYDEKLAVALDERLHGPGGLSEAQRSVLDVAYLTRYLQEDRFHRFCSPPTTPHGFRERLEDCLKFARKWI